jgi:hypothetical protein
MSSGRQPSAVHQDPSPAQKNALMMLKKIRQCPICPHRVFKGCFLSAVTAPCLIFRMTGQNPASSKATAEALIKLMKKE